MERKGPAGLVVHELACAGEELVVIEWSDHALASLPELLSPAERAILGHVVRGASNAAIARARGTAPRTVANQVASLLRKTGARSRFDLIRWYRGAMRG